MRVLLAEKAARNPAQMKLDSQIHYAAKVARRQPVADGITTLPALASALETSNDGLVHVDMKAQVSTALLSTISSLGGRVENSFPRYGAIRAWIPLLAAETLAGRADVLFIRPAARANVNTGPDVVGVIAHAADVVQAGGTTGSGVKIGVLSNGVDSLAMQQVLGNLPNTVTVLSGQAGRGDEGTAMLEIVYSMAPGAQLYFATAFTGEAQMAANIEALAAAGCKVIVDDVTYFDEPVFQDGTIAQAVNTVTASGALYFSSSANSGNADSGTSGTWEGDFVNSGTSIGGIPEPGTLNSFGGVNNDTITSTSGSNYYTIQWSDPAGASCNDYDFFILDSTLSVVLGQSTSYQTCTQNPYEAVAGNSTAIPAGSRIVIVNYQGAAAPRAIHVDTERGQLSVNTAGATFGHNAAAATITVAAASVASAGGGAFTGGSANPPEYFSSDGPRTIFYNPNGSAITPNNFLFSTNGGTTLAKVDITAADGVTTGVSGFNPFYGTSAAAPHAAAIAALVMSAHPSMTSAQVKNAMVSTALPVFFYNTRTVGSGIVMADRAVGFGGLLPQVTTGSASAITSSSATLGGSVNPNGSDTHVWFVYWVTCAGICATSSTPQQDVGSGTGTVPFSANVTGLLPNTPYSFQAWASNSAGTTSGSIASFTTSGGGAFPDLTVTSLTGPNTGLPGGQIDVSVTVVNQGNAGAGVFQLEFYFSASSTPSLSTAIDTGWGCQVASLAPGASLVCGGSIEIPSSLAAGVWYLAGAADPNNQAAESNENNNWRIADTGPVTMAASPLRFISMPPCRVADTRVGTKPPGFGPPFIAGGTTRSFALPSGPCGIPGTAQAYALNVTVVPHGNLGYLTVWPTGQSRPGVSTLNSLDGRVKANAAIVPAGSSGGAISVFATDDTDVVLDINGYFVAATSSSGLGFYPMTPCRLVDTRLSPSSTIVSGTLPAGSTTTLPILSSSCHVPSTAQAYSLNVTLVPPAAVGYLTVYPTGKSRPGVSTLNDPTGTVEANAAIAPAGTAGSINVYVTDATDLLVDIDGYFAPVGAGALSLYTVRPCRVMDTRLPSGAPPFVGAIDVDVAASQCGGTATAQAYVFNATVVPQGYLGYLTLWPQGRGQPTVSTLNAYDAAITSNMAIVPTNNTGISAYAHDSTYLILDIFGFFAP